MIYLRLLSVYCNLFFFCSLYLDLSCKHFFPWTCTLGTFSIAKRAFRCLESGNLSYTHPGICTVNVHVLYWSVIPYDYIIFRRELIYRYRFVQLLPQFLLIIKRRTNNLRIILVLHVIKICTAVLWQVTIWLPCRVASTYMCVCLLLFLGTDILVYCIPAVGSM